MTMLDSGAQFNLLLTDAMMPDVDGPTLCTTVQQLRVPGAPRGDDVQQRAR